MADILRLPTAAAERVVQHKRRGPFPKSIARLQAHRNALIVAEHRRREEARNPAPPRATRPVSCLSNDDIKQVMECRRTAVAYIEAASHKLAPDRMRQLSLVVMEYIRGLLDAQASEGRHV